MAQFRKQRVGEMLRALLATEIARMLDPRFQYITIVDVDVAPDLRNARVFWSYFDGVVGEQGSGEVVEPPQRAPSESDPKIRDIEQALLGVRPQLKRTIAQQLDLRYVPELHFRYDASAVKGSRIDFLLDRIRTPS